MEKSAREKRKKGDEIILMGSSGFLNRPLTELFRNPQKRAVRLYTDAGMTEEEAWKRAGDMLKIYGNQDAAAKAYKKMKSQRGYNLAAEIYGQEAEREEERGRERYGEHMSNSNKGEDYGRFFKIARKYKKKAKEAVAEGIKVSREKREERAEKGLVRRLATIIITFGSFIFAVFFLSANITGNVIGGLSMAASNWIGIFLFVIGLIGAYIWKRKL